MKEHITCFRLDGRASRHSTFLTGEYQVVFEYLDTYVASFQKTPPCRLADLHLHLPGLTCRELRLMGVGLGGDITDPLLSFPLSLKRKNKTYQKWRIDRQLVLVFHVSRCGGHNVFP